MAKEQWHNWGRTLTTIVTLVFVCGITYSTIGRNTDDIVILEKDVKVVQEDVHKLELQDKDIANMAKQTLDYMIKLDTNVDAIRTEQQKQATIQAVNSEKLKTLTKD